MRRATTRVSDPQHVFINCPFDPEYQRMFDAIVFAIQDCGFQARSAKEKMDSDTPRIDKILSIIPECRYGIHDLSRVALAELSGLPRFNMPLELGLFIGCKTYGGKPQQSKNYLVLDEHDYQYQKSTSDISGQDILVHQGEPEVVIRHVRD